MVGFLYFGEGMSIKKSLGSIIFLVGMTFIVYFIGLTGDFIFDDYPNLEPLGHYGTIDSWEKFNNFILSGFSGPTGRPISLATFLIDAQSWPVTPYSFKYTNLMIHLLNGILLCWAIILLLKNYNYKEQQAVWIALIASGIWLLHPYFVSTTLYIVQRMAQLATLFTLIGIIGYLKARLLLVDKPFQSYIYMAASIGVCTILATYSKENGALLPLLILVLEYCNPNKTFKPIWQWRALCLWLPSCAVLYLIFRELNFSENLWPNRNFNQVERLYSEARIVTEYLFNLFIPQIEGRGLYQDGFEISKSLFSPITTLYSVIFLFILALFGFIVKNKYPLVSVAILFFFAAHLMESTVIGLELYFEHRNYLAALFLFVPLAAGLYYLREKIEPKLVYIVIAVIFLILSFFTYERAKLWGNADQLMSYWAKKNPNSARAQSAISQKLLDQGYILEANQHLEQSLQKIPNSALLNIQLLLQKVSYGLATRQDFTRSSSMLELQAFDAQAVHGLRILAEGIISNEQQCIRYCELTLELIQNLDQNVKYQHISVYQRLSPYLKAKIYLAMGEDKMSMIYYYDAIERYNDVESGLMMVAEIASTGLKKEALSLLDKIEKLYKKQDRSKLRRSVAEYDMEIFRLKEVLTAEIAGNTKD